MNTTMQTEIAQVLGANESTRKPSKSYGKTIGTPELSEKAEKYYEELKHKYSNLDFILVSKEEKAAAQAQAGKYANPSKMVVLIDEEKIEKMANDPGYRKKYEAIISGAVPQMNQLKKSLEGQSNVVGFGCQVNSGGKLSFFAVVDQSLAAQKKRIEQNAVKKAQEKKTAAKKAEKKRAEEAAAEKLAEKKAEKKAENETVDWSNAKDFVTVEASSIEELLRKLENMNYARMSDMVMTKEEAMLGQNIDFRG